jgi:hypothetical protein
MYLAFMAKRFTSKIEHLDKLRMSYISVADDVLQEFMEEGDKLLYNQRFDVTVNDHKAEPFHSGITPRTSHSPKHE